MKARLEEADRKAQQALDVLNRAAQQKASKPATRKRARFEETSEDEASQDENEQY